MAPIPYISASALLRGKEIHGLTSSVIARIVVYLLLFGGYYINPHTTVFSFIPLIIISFMIVVSSFQFLIIIKRLNRGIAQWSGVFLDIAAIFTWTFLFEHFIDTPAVSTHGLLTSMTLMFILINSLTFEIRLPAMMGIAGIIVHGGIFVWAYFHHTDISFKWEPSQNNSAFPAIIFLFQTISVALTGVVTSLLIYQSKNGVFETSKIEKTTSKLSRYFPSELADRFARSESLPIFENGKSRNLTVLFIELQNCISLSESQNEETFLSILSDLHTLAIDLILSHGGTFHRFTENGLFAAFGTPEPSEKDPFNAVECALAIKSAVHDLNQVYGSHNLPNISVGIGLHYGNAVIGSIGTSSRQEYAVTGNAATVGSRITQAARITDHCIIVTKTLVDITREKFPFTKIGSYTVHETGLSVPIFTLAE